MQRSASSRVLATTTARHRADRAQSITPCWCCQTSGSEIPGQRAAWPSMPMMPARASVRTRATQTHNATAAFTERLIQSSRIWGKSFSASSGGSLLAGRYLRIIILSVTILVVLLAVTSVISIKRLQFCIVE